jgi:hypothetical protein
MKNLKKFTIFFVVILLFSASIFSQDSRKTTNKESIVVDQVNNFHDLETERLKVIAEMYSMMYEISGLFTELERAQSLEKSVSKYDQKDPNDIDLSSLSDQEKMNFLRLEEIKRNIIMPELQSVGGQDLKNMKSISATEGFRRIIENKVQAILKKTDHLSSVGTKVTELNNTSYVSQNFKKQISWSFALLVGIVIVGFFIIAYKDESIRDTIFSGDIGLQFVTIFSIIIAIILFGITEVLGGKEISALIGGISGYILGRSSNGKLQARIMTLENDKKEIKEIE